MRTIFIVFVSGMETKRVVGGKWAKVNPLLANASGLYLLERTNERISDIDEQIVLRD